MIGRIVSHYRIVEKLGAGGMGEVYKAEDTKLKRTVALKFLPPELTRDEAAKHRFLHEAQAASSLDHPNICNVHDIGEADEGRIFIVMACYEGETLRDRIAGGPLALPEALRIAAQTAEGLEQAHQRGIVHRDIKPANLFLTGAGLVKILDFGLAKLLGQSSLTRSGSTLGTVAYMSPEQGRGDAVDHRTDIWSLGVVLYEMAAGRAPFRGDYPQAVIYSILNEEPDPLSSVRDGMPPELDRLVEKALAKDSADRYPTMADFLLDLRAVQRKVLVAGGEGSAPRINTSSLYPVGSKAERPLVTRALHSAVKRAKRLPDTRPDKRIRRGTLEGKRMAHWTVVLTGLILVGIGLWVTWRLLLRTESPPLFGFQGSPRAVTSGDVWHGEPAVSPDGSRIAYISDESGNLDIYLTDIRSGNELKLTDDPAADHDPAWFPDGTALAFVSDRGGGAGIWKISQLGGGTTLLLQNAVDPAISPDGTQIAFSIPGKSGDNRIGVAPLDDPSKMRLLTGDKSGIWSHRKPAWSPNGKSICYSAQHDLWLIPVEGRDARQLTQGGIMDSCPTWSASGGSVFFESRRDGTLALWRVAIDQGIPERLTFGTGHENHPGICRDGSRMVYATQTSRNVFIIRDLVSGKEARIPHIREEETAGLAPDGSKLVYASSRGGENYLLWIQPLDKGIPVGFPYKLTEEAGLASHPDFSPDGKWIVYYRIIGEQRDIFIISASGGKPTPFTNDAAADYHPAWSPDGSKIAFVSERGIGSQIWIAPVRDGRMSASPSCLTNEKVTALAPAWSHDSAQIAFIGCLWNDRDVWIIPVDGKTPARQATFDVHVQRVKWGPSVDKILASGMWEGNRLRLRWISIEKGTSEELSPPVLLGPATAPGMFDTSSDGRFLFYLQEDIKGEIWTLEFKSGFDQVL